MSGKMNRPVAVVIGVNSLQGLQTARILAARGVRVIGTSGIVKKYGAATNACAEVLFVKSGKAALITKLRTLGSRFGEKGVLIPCVDQAVKIISERREELANDFHINLPPNDVVQLLLDKVRFYRYAQEKGLPIPKTFILSAQRDVEEAARHLRFPCILKPPWRPAEWVRHSKLKAFKISSPAELIRAFGHYREWVDVLIAQDWVRGGDPNHYSCNCYFNSQSEPLVTFVSQKIRQWPPGTGQGCLAVEARNDAVKEETLRLFRGLSYSGLGYLEMKRDEVSGRHFIIEPNVGRPTGRAALAEAAGVELVYTMYCDTLGLPLPAARQQAYGNVKWIHLLRDLQSAVYYWRRGRLSLGDWLKSVRGKKVCAIFSWRDPMPFVGALVNSVKICLSRRERRRQNHRYPSEGRVSDSRKSLRAREA